MKLFLVAGEPSGDALGGALMEGLRTRAPGVRFAGVGGPRMAASGLSSLFPMQELSVMGLAEVLPRYPALRRRMIQTADAVLAEPPAALITIDSPDFGLRVAARVRAARPGLRTIHYVAPSVWAWRPGRAAKMARVIDHVLALLPFEPPWMEAAGMTCDFVGHPIAASPPPDPAAVAAFRAAHGLGEAPVILALPGSRMGEVARLGPRFGATLAQVVPQIPGARVVVPTLPAVAEAVRALTATWPGDPVVIEGGGQAERRAAFGCGRAALAASGTVSLDLAAAGVPMVIGYDTHPLTRLIMERLVRVDTVTLVNLVSETRAVPECLGRACTPARLAPPLMALMADGPARAAQIAAMALCMERLGRGGPPPGERAAASVLARLG
ncbi:MAG: lipid-A-disaccharide synthase [Alkalilacustris sp.]